MDQTQHYLWKNTGRWQKLFFMKNMAGDLFFGELKKVIRLLLVLPLSNVSMECVFSVLNSMKTAHRNKSKTETITSLMVTKEGINRQEEQPSLNHKISSINFHENAKFLK